VTLPRLWVFLAVALPALAALIANLPSVDLTYHLRAGAGILDGGGIPTADSWTFTVFGDPWTDQQWGAQVILAAVYRVAGWTGLVLLRSGSSPSSSAASSRSACAAVLACAAPRGSP
jgi:hypothetical protein